MEASSTVMSSSVIFGKPADEFIVHGFGEAGVGDGGRKAHGGEFFAGHEGIRHTGAIGQDRDFRPLPEDLALPDFQGAAFLGQWPRQTLPRGDTGRR